MYRIARNGQIFGPYTEAEVRRYLASGNIALSDLVQRDGTADWIPVADMFPLAAPSIGTPVRPARLFPDPPDFPWWAALLLGLITGGVFFVVWDILEASWLRRIERGSVALMLYLGVAVLYLFKLPGMWSTINYNVFGGPYVATHVPGLGLAGLILAVASRFVFRRELLVHFNEVEGIALRLNGLWTLLFGGLYFQYKFNRINEQKRAMQVSVPTV